ncbi:MAG: lytic transglycosylase domain-containing protein [Clostridiaceae bacterium]|nr:lytic transglycosylase domain-containing protein [Clostridiaceae bacterium]
MNIPKISDILNQKIAEIQSRIPVKLHGFINQSQNNTLSFKDTLNDALSNSEPNAPVIDAGLLTGKSNSSSKKTKYPLVSGSYESIYPRLSQTQIQELMPRIDAAIEKFSEEYGVDPLLIRAVIKQESDFQPFALSTSGAMGLMQLMPKTAEGLGVSDPYNIEENIRGGVRYLSYQLDTFNDLKLALAAYNAGPNAVRKHGGIPPYEQTQNYVKKVTGYYEMYRTLEG